MNFTELTAVGGGTTAGVITVGSLFDQVAFPLFSTVVTYGELATIASLTIGALALIVSFLRYRATRAKK